MATDVGALAVFIHNGIFRSDNPTDTELLRFCEEQSRIQKVSKVEIARRAIKWYKKNVERETIG